MVRAVFFDIDGTLVSFKTHRMPESTRKALEALRGQGMKLFISTGRHELLIDNVDKSLFDGIVSLNGQCVRIGDEVIHTNAMPVEDVRAAVAFVRKHGVATIFEGVDFIRMNAVTDMAREGAALINLDLPEPTDISDIPNHPILQLIFFGNIEQEEAVLRGMPACEATRWTHLLCDIIPRGGGKHIGIQKVLDHYGFAREECMAFGDGDNDITMLRYAGIGVAMGNADAAVKAAADYVTTGTDASGIAKALLSFRDAVIIINKVCPVSAVVVFGCIPGHLLRAGGVCGRSRFILSVRIAGSCMKNRRR